MMKLLLLSALELMLRVSCQQACPTLNLTWNVPDANLNWVDQAEVIVIDDLFTLNDNVACPTGLDKCTVLKKDCLTAEPNYLAS